MSDFDVELDYFTASTTNQVTVTNESSSDVGIGIRVDNITHARLISDRELLDAIMEPIRSAEYVLFYIIIELLFTS